MTIIAGFKCQNGLVICGDSQETIPGLSKRNVTKIKVQPDAASVGTTLAPYFAYTDLALAFGGAGDAALIDKLVQRSIDVAKFETTLDGACQRIEDEIKLLHQEYAQIFHPERYPSSQLIYGVKHRGASKLFVADGPIVNEVEKYYSVGCGYYMADFLASRLFNEYSDVYQGVLLATYILHNAKEHVDGCGGQSYVAVLQNEGISDLVPRDRVEAFTELTSAIDLELGKLLLNQADLRKGPKKEDVDDMVFMVDSLRKFAKEDISKHDQWVDSSVILEGSHVKQQRDDLGFIRRDQPEGAGVSRREVSSEDK